MMYYFFIILLIIVGGYCYKRIINRESSVIDTSLSEQINTDVSEIFIKKYIMTNDKYIIENQGKTKFTKQEIAEIERLLTLLRLAPSHKQKSIRQQLRDIGFYISKYGTGLTVERFRNMVATGEIKVIKNNVGSMHKSTEKKKIKSSEVFNNSLCKSFKPIVFENSKILILGTMPGKDSLMTGEYYASSSNSFWKIIETIYNNGNKFANYKEKVSCLKKNRISLWDVYGQCDRKGSLDSSIRNEVLNDIDAFLLEHSSIKRIVFNGKKAASAYLPKIEYSVLCSTSNSNSRLSFAAKVEEWKKCLKEH